MSKRIGVSTPIAPRRYRAEAVHIEKRTVVERNSLTSTNVAIAKVLNHPRITDKKPRWVIVMDTQALYWSSSRLYFGGLDEATLYTSNDQARIVADVEGFVVNNNLPEER